MKRTQKLLILLTISVMMLTSCSLLPTTFINSTSGTGSEQVQLPEQNTGDTVTISREEYERLLQFQELVEIQDYVDQYYYQEPVTQDMLDGAAMGMLYGLDDPYTFYYTPEEYETMWEEDEGNYAGIGIMITGNYNTGLCTVTRVFLDSPALEAGLKKGDVLVKVEDIDVTATTLQDAVDIMRGEIGQPVNLTVRRGDQLLDFVIVRAEVHTNYVNSCMMEGNVGYISLYEFSGECATEFENHLNKLVEQGATSLIIDLRDNPGGWVNAAVSIADVFLDKGSVATLRYRDGSEESYTTRDGAVDLPVVVLVNENSASASEILAGCLQDRERATIVGTTTYGKGVVQWVLPIGDRGAGMQLTIAQYFTPNGNEVHKVGITPDVEAIMPEELVSEMYDIGDLNDPQLKVAYDEALKLAQ
ncbi:MAG: S41 family peptidase [Clostridiales bacterium]|nr:S41 family peptidase [Clostridiales bacterium]